MPRAVEDQVGAVGIEFLNDLTGWAPRDRPTAASCLRQPFVDVGPLRCIGDGRIYPGRRHAWRLVLGHMEPELLCWLRAEAAEQLDVWKAGAFAAGPELLQPATKHVLAGKVAEQCFSKSLNSMDISKTLPAPRLRSVVRAFTKANQAAIIALAAKCQAKLEQLQAGGEYIGTDGSFVLGF